MNMRKQHKSIVSGRKLLFLALLAAFGPVHAEDDEDVASLTSPNGRSVTVGAGVVSGKDSERSIFGQYTGWSDHDSALLLDMLFVKRDDAGLWTRVEGLNLGQDSREFSISQEKQGDWKFGFGYSGLNSRDIYTASTGSELDLERRNIRFELTKWITPHLSVDASFRSEDKEGQRLSGVGCSAVTSAVCTGVVITGGTVMFLPEPVDSTTRQIEAKLTWFGDKFSVTGGYYGTLFDNSNPTQASAALAPAWPATTLALAPDNQSHQFSLSGTYALRPDTRMTFKYARTEMTQDQDFGALGAGNLDGKVVTHFGQFGVVSNPLPKLSLSGNVRYEDRNDKTPLGNYRVDSLGTLYTNTPDSWTKLNSKAEASYQFTPVYRGTFGVDYEMINRERPVSTTYIPGTSLAALRTRTNELGYRAEVRRSMSDTINAAVSVNHKKRDGYHWVGADPASGYPYISYAAAQGLAGTSPSTLMNRDRDTLKLMADWVPTDALSLQFWFEDGKDSYKGLNGAGLHNSETFSLNLDAAYQISDDWKATGYFSTGEQTLRMRQDIGYIANLENLTTTFGLGASGKIAGTYEVGGDLTLIEDRNHYRLGMSTGAVVPDLPTTTYRNTTLKLYGKRAIDKVSDLRVDLVQQWADFNDWTWRNFAYSDGTTVGLNPNQDVTYLGVRYSYRFK